MTEEPRRHDRRPVRPQGHAGRSPDTEEASGPRTSRPNEDRERHRQAQGDQTGGAVVIMMGRERGWFPRGMTDRGGVRGHGHGDPVGVAAMNAVGGDRQSEQHDENEGEADRQSPPRSPRSRRQHANRLRIERAHARMFVTSTT